MKAQEVMQLMGFALPAQWTCCLEDKDERDGMVSTVGKHFKLVE